MRANNWASQLHAIIESHRTRQFEWGSNDCCLFVARVVDAMTGSTHEEKLLQMYSSERTALEFIAPHGSLSNTVSVFLGPPSNARATRGDVVLFDGGEGDAVGICTGPMIVGVGPDGLRSVPREEIRQVWRIV